MTDDEGRRRAADGSGLGTRSVHAGHESDPATGAVAPPLYQTTSYEFEDADGAADLYALEREGDIYSRISNPTTRALEDRVASLEGGAGAGATANGMAALDALTLVLADQGDNVVCSTDTYGGTTTYLSANASKRGVEPRFVDTLDYAAYEEAVDGDTAYVHVETVGNPSLVTPDLERVAAIAHEAGAPLVVDNTFATPALCRPLDHGADVVWNSTTKWLHGSGTTVGGVLVDGGSFDWRDHADAYQTLQGIETLPLRMERHCENAAVVAEYLADHDDVAWVAYPGLESHETHENASKYLEGGYGGMVAFGLEDGFEAGKAFC